MEHLFILFKWFIFYIIGLLIAIKFPVSPFYLLICTGFSIGFILRKLNLYPGKPEPLWLDGYTAILSFFIFLLSIRIKIPPSIGLLMIFSLHIIFNIIKIIESM